jgi:hypothetical protein
VDFLKISFARDFLNVDFLVFGFWSGILEGFGKALKNCLNFYIFKALRKKFSEFSGSLKFDEKWQSLKFSTSLYIFFISS